VPFIQSNAHAKFMQLLEDVERRDAIGDQHGFSDLELKPTGLKPGGSQRTDNYLCEIGRLELHDRQIDGDLEVRRPRRGLSAGLAQHPLANGHDETGRLGHRDKIGRRHKTQFRMVPAQKCFATANLIRLKVENRLVMQHKFT
jgi:hypothetical protein